MTTPLVLSHSQMETFEQCARRWQLTKINRVRQAPSEALVLGDAVHQAIEADGRAAVEQRARLDIPQLVAQFSYALGQRLMLDDPQHLLKPQWQQLRLRGLALLRAYHEQYASAYAPEAVEAPFPEVTLPSAYTGVPDVRFTGRLDARQGSSIIDFKTASKPWPVGAEHQKPQALAYLWADLQAQGEERAAKSVRFIVLSALAQPYPQQGAVVYDASVDVRVTTPRRSDVEAYGQRVRSVARLISEAKALGRFDANPGPLCGWCGVLGACSVGQRWMRGRGRTPAVVMVDGASGKPLEWSAGESQVAG